MNRAARKVDAIIAAACEQVTALLESEVKQVLRTSNRYESFSAAMGTCCFYDAKTGHPVDDIDLTKAARAVVALAWEVTDTFGSPGTQIAKKNLC